MVINIIACIAKNGGIGYNNQLLFHIKEDMERFRKLTMGHTILMGRKTYESLPHGALPGRRNIVVSRTVHELDGCDVFSSIQEALLHSQDKEEIFIIGGESIYQQTLHLAHKIFLTKVDCLPTKADTYFPEIKSCDWTTLRQETYDTSCHKGEQSVKYHFIELIRKDR